MKARYGSLAIYVVRGKQKSDRKYLGKKSVSSVRVSVIGENMASVNTWSFCFVLFFSHHTFKAQFTFIEHMVIVQILLSGNHSIFCGFPLALTHGGTDSWRLRYSEKFL